MAYNTGVSFEEVMEIHSQKCENPKRKKIKTAYKYASEKHKGMTRGTGEPYVCHPLRVARLVADWGCSSDTVIGALLHDVVEDCNIPLTEIKSKFGADVAELVDAVTSLSDKDFAVHTLTKNQKDILSDAKLQKKMNVNALYVKIADRIDNLNTVSGVPENKRIPKAEHTREIIIPLAKLVNAYYFVNVLEDLCFRIEHPKMYESLVSLCDELCEENNEHYEETIHVLSSVFKGEYEDEELSVYSRYIKDFLYCRRSDISVYRQIGRAVENIDDWKDYLTNEKIALYDLNLIVSDELSEMNFPIRQNTIFFEYYERILSKKGILLIKHCFTTYNDASYFLLQDAGGNMYRFFVRTEKEYQRFLYGNIVDENPHLSLSDVNEIDPRDTYNEKIKVFRKDGSAMTIDKGATMLDFAFYIHSDVGYHFDHAEMMDSDRTHLQASTRLNEGDRIIIHTNENIKPDITWFKHVKTSKAVHHLIRYFQKNYNL